MKVDKAIKNMVFEQNNVGNKQHMFRMSLVDSYILK